MQMASFVRTPVVAIACLAPVLASAQSDVEIAYGIRIGGPLSVPECPKMLRGGAFVMYERSPMPCVKADAPTAAPGDFTRGGMIVFPFNQRPAQSSWDSVGLVMHEGRVGALVVGTFGHAVQSTIFDDLVAKYGKPVESAMLPVQNAMGAKYESIVAQWEVGTVHVQFFGISGKLNQGLLLIGTKDGLAERQARIDRVLKSTRTPL